MHKRREGEVRNILTVEQKSWFLKWQPKWALQKLLHGPCAISDQLQPLCIQIPVGRKFRMLCGGEQVRVLREEGRLLGHIGVVELLILRKKVLQLEDSST